MVFGIWPGRDANPWEEDTLTTRCGTFIYAKYHQNQCSNFLGNKLSIDSLTFAQFDMYPCIIENV